MTRLFLILLLMCTATLAEAQRKFTGGILAGPLFSQISGDGLGGWDKLGFGGGAWVGVPLSEKNTVTMSMKYVMKGSRSKRDTLTFTSFAYHLNYIDVPVLFERKFKIKKSEFSWCIGPYAGILLNQKVIANGFEYAVENYTGRAYNTLDIGAMGGLSGWVSDRLFIQYTLSTSVLPTRPAPLVVNKKSYYEQGNYNQTMQLMFGLRFGKGEES